MTETQRTAVCIAGMHRSGTSMIARVLNLCGMDLGQPAELMPADPANPEGYWEHTWFNTCNNQVLAAFVGAWDIVPAYPENWTGSDAVAGIRAEAPARAAAFGGGVWGWKDPRNSITLPLWKSIFPDLKVVLCLRNPIDVAQSLFRRGSNSLVFGMRLWWQYNAMVLGCTSEDGRMVTHFDSFFANGAAEMDRLVSQLRLWPDEQARALALSSMKQSLRHSTMPLEQLRQICPWTDLLGLYCRLLCEAGPVCRELHRADWSQITDLAAAFDLQRCLAACGLGKDGPLPAQAPADQHAGDARCAIQTLRLQTQELSEALRSKSDELTKARDQVTRAIGIIKEVEDQRDQAIAIFKDVEKQRDAAISSYRELETLANARREHIAQIEALLAGKTDEPSREQLQAEVRSLQEEIRQVQSQRDHCGQQLNTQIDRANQLHDLIRQVEDQRDKAIASYNAVAAEVAAIKASRTWRLLRLARSRE